VALAIRLSLLSPDEGIAQVGVDESGRIPIGRMDLAFLKHNAAAPLVFLHKKKF
jgi:hypothetical protein